MCLAQGHNTVTLVGFEPRTSRFGVRRSTTTPPRSLWVNLTTDRMFVVTMSLLLHFSSISLSVHCLLSYSIQFILTCPTTVCIRAAPVAEWLRSLTSVLLIIRSSHRCGFAPRTEHEFICETSHVLLAGVSGVFSPGTPVFAPPTD